MLANALQYELALAKDRAHDVNILACLGRVWLARGRHESVLSHMKTALEYSQQALKVAPGQNHLQFNVAFVQFQVAQLVYNSKETQRTLVDVEEAQKGLEEAINTLDAVANSPNPPFSKNDIIQRANMARNTMRKQLVRAHEIQTTYEQENASKLEQARQLRDAELKKREEEKRRAEEEAEERKRKILEERLKLEERDREYMEKRAEEERRRQELIDDSEMRRSERKANRGKGGKRKKKSTAGDSDTDGLGSESDARPRRRRTSASGTDGLTDEERPKTKKRKLARKSEPAGKFKSTEFVDSDSDGEAAAPAGDAVEDDAVLSGTASENGDEGIAAPKSGRKTARVISEDEDEDEGVTAPKADGDVVMDDDEDE
jgi:RNA polymerase-associated protein CTR9